MKYYTYILIDSLTDQPFYVGKGSGSRMYQHKIDATHPNYSYRSVHRKIQNILNNNGKIIYKKINHETENNAFAEEIVLIERYGRKDLGKGVLCNLTDGGEGASVQSPESVEKRAAKHRGMKRSEESKQRMKAAQLQMAEERRQKYGSARSPESVQKQSNATKGRKWSERARTVKRNKPTAKVVLAYRKDNNSFVGQYESISACARELKCDTTAIWKICGGKYPIYFHKGYFFQYK